MSGDACPIAQRFDATEVAGAVAFVDELEVEAAHAAADVRESPASSTREAANPPSAVLVLRGGCPVMPVRVREDAEEPRLHAADAHRIAQTCHAPIHAPTAEVARMPLFWCSTFSRASPLSASQTCLS